MFGAVNALFTGLAFATLIYTTWMQREELALQRQELTATRAELAGQREQLRQQNETLTLQRFENTFFALLRTHGEIVDAMQTLDGNSRVVSSRACFHVWYAKLGESHAQYAIYPPGGAAKAVDEVYWRFYKSYQAHLGHYFRHLYHIIKFVDEAQISNKQRYTSLVRAQLSAYEHVLLFYNCASRLGREKFKPLVEKYALLENLPLTELIADDIHVPLFSTQAYGSDSEA